MKKIPHKIITFGLILFLTLGLSGVGRTNAYYDDTETSGGNSFSTSSLDFSLDSDADFSPDVTPTINSTRSVDVSNDGSLGFEYSVRVDNFTGDTSLCNALNLEANLDGGAPSEYSGALTSFAYTVGAFSAPENWVFTVNLTDNDSGLQGKTCNFDIVFDGWQIGGAGFSDTETIANTVTAGTWGYGPIGEFAVFGASDVSDTHQTETGNSTDIVGGMIGSNRSVSIGGSNVQLGIRAGGKVTTGNSTTVGAQGIIANGSVTLGGSNIINGSIHGASVTSGNTSNLNGDVVSGGLFSSGGSTQVSLLAKVDAQSATLGNSADILGTLTLPLSVLPTLGSGATVGTLVNSGTPPPATPDTFTDISLPTPNVFSASTDAGKNIDINAGNSPLTLAPGIYRDLTSGNSRTLNLSAGTYVFRSISLGGSNIINADVSGGEILIFVVGNVTTGSSLAFNLTGGTADKVYLESGGVVTLGGSNDWYGTIYSTKSDVPNQFGITTGSTTNVWGGLYSAEQIQLGGSNDITLVGPFFGTYVAPTNVPDVVLNEIYANPAGGPAPSDREWIELYNNSASPVDVLGWKISEMSPSTEIFYTLVASGATLSQVQPYAGASTIIPSGGLLVIEFGGLAAHLNNTGDTVRLYSSTNIFKDGHVYPSTAVGKSHQRIPDGGIWVDPEPTPGEPNRVSMQDLIDAGVPEKTIQLIIGLLSERGETLLDEVSIEEKIIETTATEPILDEVIQEIVQEPTPEIIVREEIIDEPATLELTPVIEEAVILKEPIIEESEKVVEPSLIIVSLESEPEVIEPSVEIPAVLEPEPVLESIPVAEPAIS